MTTTRQITISGVSHTVVLSDDSTALQAAGAAGRAVVGLWDKNHLDRSLFPAFYVIENIEQADRDFLTKVVLRHLGLPWEICCTKRLTIREFTLNDAENIPGGEYSGPGDFVFLSQETLSAYIKHQYTFFEYGIWAVIEKVKGQLIGKAGLSDLPLEVMAQFPALQTFDSVLELSYHIFSPYRNKGYALETCTAILDYGETYGLPIAARVSSLNKPSMRLLKHLGFTELGTCSPCPGENILLYIRKNYLFPV